MPPTGLPGPDEVRAQRVRLSASESDGYAGRWRVEALLAALPGRVAGQPPTALLCVRRLAMQRRHGAELQRAGPRSPPAAQTRALAQGIDALAAHAARPAAGTVPASANAVLFADTAELLACLASDRLSGHAPTRWWWRAVFGSAAGAEAAAEAASQAPQFVPALVQQLARDHQAVAWVRTLHGHALTRLLQSVAVSHGLQALLDEPSAWTQDAEPAVPHRAATAEPPAPAVSVTPTPPAAKLTTIESLREHRPGWQRTLLPEAATPGLTPDQRLLLTLTLGLVRAPAALRQAAWQAAAGSRSADTALAPDTQARPARLPPEHQQQGPAQPPVAADAAPAPAPAAPSGTQAPKPAAEADARPGTVSRGSLDPPGPAAESPARATYASRTEGAAHPAAQAGAVAQAPDHVRVEQSPAGLRPASADTAPSIRPATAPPRSRTLMTTSRDGSWVRTEYGGLFHLVNTALALGLYNDFTCPAEPGLALPLWDFLALAGEGLIGPELHEDPVWALLAHLSARDPEEAPGLHFNPPGSDQGVCTRARWLDDLMCALRARIAQDLDEPDQHLAVELLIRQPARVAVSAARLDVHLWLDKLPIAVRLAGLDRNPGWVPAGGRTIAFHYD